MTLQEHTTNAVTLGAGAIVKYMGITTMNIGPSQGAIDEALKIVVSGLMGLLTQWILMKRQQRKNRKSGGNNAAVILALLFVLPSCTIKKLTTEKTETTTLEAFREVKQKSDSSRISSHRIIKDSIFSFPARYASGIFHLSDLTPLYTPKGNAVPRELKAQGKGINATITVNPDSSISLNATSDSFQTMIPGLIERIEELESHKTSEQEVSEKEMSYSEAFHKSKKWILANPGVAAGIIALLIIGAHGDKIFNLIFKRKG